MAMKRILVGIDGSNESRAAAKFAASLARDTGAKLTLAAVGFRPDPMASPELVARTQAYADQEIENLTQIVGAQAADLAGPGVEVETLVESGSPAAALAEIAGRLDVDLVVVGHRGRGAIKRLLIGSVADQLVQISPRPVTVVR